MLKNFSCITKLTFVFLCSFQPAKDQVLFVYTSYINAFDIALTKNLHSECDEGNLGEEFNDKDMMKSNPSRASSGMFEIFAKANEFYLGHHRVSYLSPPLNDSPFVEIHPPPVMSMLVF